MGTKDNPGEFDCYGSAEADEPLFILKASNQEAPETVEDWAERYEARKRKENTYDARAQRKVKEAIGIAEEMRTWRSNRNTLVPKPMPGMAIDECTGEFVPWESVVEPWP